MTQVVDIEIVGTITVEAAEIDDAEGSVLLAARRHIERSNLKVDDLHATELGRGTVGT